MAKSFQPKKHTPLANYRNLLIFILAVVNFYIFLRLDFFLPQLAGKAQLQDFNAYYQLISAIKETVNPYAVSSMQTQGPPSVFIYYLPLTFFAKTQAVFLITTFNILAGFAVSYLLSRKCFSRKSRLPAFLILNSIFFSSFPSRFSLEMGQPGLFLAFLATIIITSSNETKKSLSLSAMIITKTVFIFTVASFLKSKKLILKTILFLLLILLVGSVLIGPDLYIYYFKYKFLAYVNSGNVPVGIDYYNQSLKSTLHRIGMLHLYETVFVLLTLTFTFLCYRFQSFTLAICASLILPPTSWQHYYPVLFPVMVFLFIKMRKKPLDRIMFSLTTFLWWVEFPALHQLDLNPATGLVASHYFFSAIVLFLLTARNEMFFEK